MDVKIEFLNRDLGEEIYMDQPEDYVLRYSPIKGKTHNLGGDFSINFKTGIQRVCHHQKGKIVNNTFYI